MFRPDPFFWTLFLDLFLDGLTPFSGRPRETPAPDARVFALSAIAAVGVAAFLPRRATTGKGGGMKTPVGSPRRKIKARPTKRRPANVNFVTDSQSGLAVVEEVPGQAPLTSAAVRALLADFP